jgi:predicted NUDIX family NTP pyrophosphohydrolase
MQLQALLDLHSMDVGSEIQVERTASGTLLIHGVLASDERVRNIRSSLSSIAADPSVRMEVYSVDELSRIRRNTQAGAISVEGYSIDASQRPADQALRSHFESLGYRGQQLDDQIRSYSSELEDDAAEALQRAWALRDFSRSFTARELASLPEQDRKSWFTLLSEQTKELDMSLGQLQHQSAWLLAGSDLPPDGSLASSPPRSSTTQETIDSLFRDVSETNKLLRSMLMASPDPGTASPQQVSESLLRARSSVSALQGMSAQYQAQSRP